MQSRGTSRQTLEETEPGPDLESEYATLGALLLWPQGITEIKARLGACHFHSETNKTIYDAMLKMHRRGDPIDSVLLVRELKDTGKWESEANKFGVTLGALTKLFDVVPTGVNVKHYARLVRENADKRAAWWKAAKKIAGMTR